MLGRALRAAPFGRHRPAVRRQAVASSIRFLWDANDAADEVTGYTLYWAAATGGPYDNSVSIGNVTAYSINHPGVTRYYVLTATNATGTSDFSNELTR